MSLCISNKTSLEFIHFKVHLLSICLVDLCLILNHTRVSRHVCEEYQWQTTCEETCTTTNLKALITKYIPCETYTWRKSDTVLRPLTCINVATIVVELIDSIVSHEVTIVEEETIKTKTVSKL